MTENKPIIIKGIDVSECEQLIYKDSLNPMCGNTGICCYGRDNCYYKQLKLLELKLKVTETDYEASEQECEELKKQYNCYACDTCKGKEDYINLKRHCENAIKSLHNKHTELDKLKAAKEQAEQKLGRIRVIAFHNFDITDKNDPCYKILQIIDEVE